MTIDTLTGEYQVERADVLEDVGRSLNPAIDIGQVEGGFIQGMGWLTTEELWWDGKGRLRTHAPSTYKIPLASDVPRDFNVWLADWSVNQRAGDRPLQGRRRAAAGARLLGGRGAVDGGGLGRRLRDRPNLDMPATPERVLMGGADAGERRRRWRWNLAPPPTGAPCFGHLLPPRQKAISPMRLWRVARCAPR